MFRGYKPSIFLSHRFFTFRRSSCRPSLPQQPNLKNRRIFTLASNKKNKNYLPSALGTEDIELLPRMPVGRPPFSIPEYLRKEFENPQMWLKIEKIVREGPTLKDGPANVYGGYHRVEGEECIKIGFSTKVVRRVKELKKCFKFLGTIVTYPFQHSKMAEKLIHLILKESGHHLGNKKCKCGKKHRESFDAATPFEKVAIAVKSILVANGLESQICK